MRPGYPSHRQLRELGNKFFAETKPAPLRTDREVGALLGVKHKHIQYIERVALGKLVFALRRVAQ